MNKKTLRFFCWITLATFTPLSGVFAAPAGQITQSSGDVSVSSPRSEPKSASQGQPIESGQTVTVGDRGRAMLQFRDGQTIALKSQTIFKVDSYEYDQATPEKGESFFSLLQGGLRAITGLIGSSNRAGWKLATPTATMGIRGTDFIAAMDQGLYLKVNSGAVSTSNSSGTTVFTAGQTGFVATGTAAGTVIPASSVPAGTFGDLEAAGLGGASGAAAGSTGAAGGTLFGVPTGVVVGVGIAAGVAAAAAGSGNSSTHH
jgi:hypothetical protein